MRQLPARAALYSICLCLVPLCWLRPVLAETDPNECYQADIDYHEDSSLTRAERLEAMNDAFFDSINRFEECVLSSKPASSTGHASGHASGHGGGPTAGTESGEEGSQTALETAGSVNSAAAPELRGTEAETDDTPVLAGELPSEEASAGDTRIAVTNPAAGTGKAPEDIPPAANDDAVAAQIRLAAELESDPVKKAKLWNEYRKYQGLPVNTHE